MCRYMNSCEKLASSLILSSRTPDSLGPGCGRGLSTVTMTGSISLVLFYSTIEMSNKYRVGSLSLPSHSLPGAESIFANDACYFLKSWKDLMERTISLF